MNVSLTPELAGFVKEQVASGMYHSASEVIREGLRLLKERRENRHLRIEEFRRQIAVGLEQAERGEVGPLDIEAIRAEGLRELAKRQRPESGDALDG